MRDIGLQDSIQVVSPIEIFRPNQNSHLLNNETPILSNEPPIQQLYYPEQNDYPQINFAPKIIVNGSDNSNLDNVEPYSTEKIDFQGGMREPPMIIHKKQIENTNEDISNDNNNVDFNKPLLIVKKN
jgi:hypothetical protein